MFSRMVTAFLILSASGWMACSTQADTILVPNGDFELPSVGEAGYVIGQPNNWTVTNPYSSGVSVAGAKPGSGQFFFYSLTASDLQFIFQDSFGGNLEAGKSYRLDFDYANGGTSALDMGANVTYGTGGSWITNGHEVFSIAGSQGWTHGSVTGIAGSEVDGQVLGVSFAFVTPATAGAYQPLLDNVTLTVIPEPSAILLLSISLVGLLAYAWRKRR